MAALTQRQPRLRSVTVAGVASIRSEDDMALMIGAMPPTIANPAAMLLTYVAVSLATSSRGGFLSLTLNVQGLS
jgi:hypothetical protein